MSNQKNVTMKTKLIISFLAVGIIPLSLVGVWSSLRSTDALMQKSYNALESVREVKKGQIESYFHERQGDMGVLVETVATLRREAMAKLVAVRNIKQKQIEGYFAERMALMKDVQKNLRFTRGVVAFAAVFPNGLESAAYNAVYNQRIEGLGMFREIFGFYGRCKCISGSVPGFPIHVNGAQKKARQTGNPIGAPSFGSAGG